MYLADYHTHCAASPDGSLTVNQLAEAALRAGLDGDDVQLITEADNGYVLKFRAVELWERLRQWLGK